MALEKIANKIVKTDVLVVGGGIAGCPAAAKAAEHGLKVTLVDKSKVDRSGSAAIGIDHYNGAYPRGMTPQQWQELEKNLGPMAYYGGGPYSDPSRVYRMYANGLWAIEELEKLGVTMRWDGELRPIHFSYGVPCIRVHWTNVKPEMADGVRKRGVNVLERTMIINLLTSKGAVVGATAIDTRDGGFIVIKAKATIIATAACSRVYDPETPQPWKYKYRYHWCPASVSGDGWAMAYRAGAELANMEHAGVGYRMRDDLVLSQGNNGNEGISSKRMTWDGEEIVRGNAAQQAELQRTGRNDPVYNNLGNIPDDFHKRIEVAYVDERLVSFKIAEDRGFNPRTHWYEIMETRPNQLHVPPGIWSDANFKTSVKGLYAIGDCVAGCHDVANAATSGFLVGDSVGSFVKSAGEVTIDESQVESQKEVVDSLKAVKDGTEPVELESAIRYACTRYIGVSKSEGKMREGLRRLASLRREFLNKLKADNPHYLMRAMEVRNIIDIAEIHLRASLERKETRGMHIRLDYPEQDPSLNKMLLFQRLENGEMVIQMKKQPELDMSLKEDR